MVRAERHLGREPVERKLQNDARMLLREMERQQRKADEAGATAASARSELSRMREKASERFGRDVPADALLLDVLESVEIVEGDRWIWLGLVNNQGLATIRVRNSEQSLVRYLAVQFGVIEESEFGMLFPRDVGPGQRGDTTDVNPFHRVLRGSDMPLGNRSRYSFDPPTGVGGGA